MEDGDYWIGGNAATFLWLQNIFLALDNECVPYEQRIIMLGGVSLPRITTYSPPLH